MRRVLVLGAGKIGALISGLLAESGDYQVQLADVNGLAAESVARAHGFKTLESFALDVRDTVALAAHLRAHPVDAVISSLPYYCNPDVARAARYVRRAYDYGMTRRQVLEAVSAVVPMTGMISLEVGLEAMRLADTDV